jgi:hypothetical protein
MKYIEGAGGLPVVELTRRNLRTLLAKLDDPLSTRALLAPDGKVVVRAVPGPGDRGNADAQAAAAAVGVIDLTRTELQELLRGLDCPARGFEGVEVGGVRVRAVEDAEHYRERAPGAVWMPSSGEWT